MIKKDFETLQKELAQTRLRVRRVEVGLDHTLCKQEFQEEQRKLILETVEKQVVPVQDLVF